MVTFSAKFGSDCPLLRACHVTHVQASACWVELGAHSSFHSTQPLGLVVESCLFMSFDKIGDASAPPKMKGEERVEFRPPLLRLAAAGKNLDSVRHTLKCIFINKRLCITRACGNREPESGIYTTSYREICTAE